MLNADGAENQFVSCEPFGVSSSRNYNFIQVSICFQLNAFLYRLPQANLQENYMPTHHEYVFGQFVVSPKRRKIFAQLCKHKNYGTTFQGLLIAEESVSVPIYTIRDPKVSIQSQFNILDYQIISKCKFYFLLTDSRKKPCPV